MAIVNGYCTLAQVRSAVGNYAVTDTADDAEIELAVEAASRGIDSLLGYRLWQDGTVKTREFFADKTDKPLTPVEADHSDLVADPVVPERMLTFDHESVALWGPVEVGDLTGDLEALQPGSIETDEVDVLFEVELRTASLRDPNPDERERIPAGGPVDPVDREIRPEDLACVRSIVGHDPDPGVRVVGSEAPERDLSAVRRPGGRKVVGAAIGDREPVGAVRRERIDLVRRFARRTRRRER